MEAFARFLLYPTITAFVNGLAAPEKLRFAKQQSALAADTSLPESQRGLHSTKATHTAARSAFQWRCWLMRLVSCTKPASALSLSSTPIAR